MEEVFTGVGANVNIGGNVNTLTAATKSGLTYKFRQSATLEALANAEPADTTIGDGNPWTPDPTSGFLTGDEAFFSIEVTK